MKKCTCGGTLPCPYDAPSSPVGKTDAPARPIPPDALNGLTGAAYTDVIRREAAGEAAGDYDAFTQQALIALAERARVEVSTLRGNLATANATIERLWAQLEEATNTPHNDPEFGFDKTAPLSDPGWADPCPESCAGQSWTGVDQAEGPGKVWRCDTCGRIVGQHVSNPIQAADDRRAL